MKKFKWYWSKPLKVAGNIVAIAGLLVVIIGLNFLVQRSNNENNPSDSQTDRLNVAIVNEDQAVTNHKKNYNLGSDYIKKIERDNSQNWTVTTRSTAESGLRSGRYQLAIFIPNDFSSKVLDINNVLVDKTTVTYKINAKGNTQVESDAKQVGNKLVSDLNSQLVNMYLASVLGNLYTAQQNAKAVSALQNKNIGDYQNDLLQSAINFEDVFPSLVSISNGSLEANNSLSKTLQDSASQADKDNVDGSKVSKDLASLLSDYSEGKASNSDIAANAMSNDPETFSKQLNTVISQLESDQSTVSKLLKKSDETNNVATDPSSQPEGSKKAYQEVLKEATKQLNELETKLKSAKDNRYDSETNVQQIVEEELKKYYGKSTLEELDSLTLNDLLSKGGKADLNYDVNAYKSDINSLVSNAVDILPSANVSGLADLKGVTTDYTAKITDYDGNTHGFATQDSLGLSSNLSNAAQAYRDVDQTQVNPTSTVGQTEDATLETSGVEVESWYVVVNGQAKDAVAPSEKITIDPSQQNTFRYNIKPGTISEDAKLDVKLGGVKVTTQEGKIPDLAKIKEKLEAYTAVAQSVVDAYNNAGKLLNTYFPDGSTTSITDNFFNQSAKTLLVNLLSDAVLDAVRHYSPDQDVNGALTDLQTTRTSLENDLKMIIETNDKVESDIGETLKALRTIQGNDTKNSKENKSESKDRANKYSDLSSNISKLVSQSEALKASAKSNAKSAESVSKSFSSFNDAAKKAQENGQKLSGDAKKLMIQFNAELSDTNDFVKSFKDVLNNAYNNGVPNEALLEFLSSPVASRSSSYKSRINTYRPFTWILLLAVISLFTAYLFAIQDLIGRVKNKFAKGLLADTDPLNVGTLTALALIEGLALGIASARAMALDREMIPSWILVFVLFSMALLHGQYFLMSHMKSIGMALGLYNLVSFVYFSSAVGTTVGLTGFLRQLKRWNPLSLMEKTLSAYFDNITADGGLILALIAMVVMLIALNTIVRFPWEKQTNEEENVA